MAEPVDSKTEGTNSVINLDDFRSKKSEEKKRKTERIFFHHLVGAYGVIQPGKMAPIELIDVSEDGLGIQVPFNSERAWPSESSDITVRLYFSADSYLELKLDVKNSKPTIDSGSRYVRYGCLVQKNQRGYEAWKAFVGFLRVYTDASEKDAGNIGVGSL
jgi:hypothetical protein